MSGHEPATKHDIADLEQKIEQLRSEMNHGNRDLLARLDDIATKMFSAVYNIAETHEKRLTDLDSSNAALRSRLATVESRIMEIEKLHILRPLNDVTRVPARQRAG